VNPNATTDEIKVLSTHAVYEVLGEIGPAFERASGRKLSCRYDPSKAVRRRIESGEVFDVAIITRPVIDELAGQRKILPQTCIDLGRSGLGVSVRKGAHKPDIATVEDFTRALLAARSVVRSAEGASGQYFEKLLDRLGIADAMRGKIRIGGSGRVAELVASGEAELAVQQVSELRPVTGADYVGPFPPELQLYTVFAAGVGTACNDRATAKMLVDMLAAPAARPLFEASGLEPAVR